MVGLNGNALPDQDFNYREFNESHTSLAAKDPPPRRIRSRQISSGPKPLLPRSLKEALQLAELLSKSKLIPKGFDTPETCLVGILYGMEVGLSPIAALQRMAVIDGRPTIWGDAALALVQASGLLQSIEEEIIEKEDSDNRKILTAICKVKREGRSEPTTGTFSNEDAKRAGLWQKPGPWTDYPKRMLTMRARAFALRDAFPDVLAGLYIREEFDGAEKRQSGMPHVPLTTDDEWNSQEVRTDFGKTNPKTSSGNNDIRRQGSDISLDAKQTGLPSAANDIKGEFHLPSNTEYKISYPRRAPPPPPPSASTDYSNGILKEAVFQPHDSGLSPDPQSPDKITSEMVGDSTHQELLDPETILEFFDSALCCALDLPTLEEIVDDFAERLSGISKDHQKRAQKIIERHQSRVEELDQSFGMQRSEGFGDTPEQGEINGEQASCIGTPTDDQDLPSGLRALLPSLGLGSMQRLRRRQNNKGRQARSLASWNARQRLQALEFKNNTLTELEYRDDQEGEL